MTLIVNIFDVLEELIINALSFVYTVRSKNGLRRPKMRRKPRRLS